MMSFFPDTTLFRDPKNLTCVTLVLAADRQSCF